MSLTPNWSKGKLNKDIFFQEDRRNEHKKRNFINWKLRVIAQIGDGVLNPVWHKKPLKWRLAFLENSYVGTSDRPFKYMEVHIQQNGRWPLYGKKIYTKRWEMNKWTKRNNTSKKVPGVMFKVRSTKLFVVKTTQFGGNKIHFTKFPPAGRQLLSLGINRFPGGSCVNPSSLCALVILARGCGKFPAFSKRGRFAEVKIGAVEQQRSSGR